MMLPPIVTDKKITLYDNNGILTYEAVYQLYHQSLTPLRVIGTDFSILTHNPAMNSLCQVMDPQIIGKHCYEIAHSDICGTEDCPVRQILNGAQKVIQHYECTLWNGKYFPATTNSTPFYNEKGEIIGIIQSMRDQSDLTAFSRSLEKKNREMELSLQAIKASYEIIKGITEEMRLETMTKRFFEILSKYFKILAGIFYIFDKKEEILVPVFLKGILKTPLPVALGDGHVGEAANRQEITFWDNVSYEHLNVSSGILSPTSYFLTCIPIISNDELMGMIELASLDDLQDRKGLFESISAQLGVIIQNILYVEELSNLKEELQETNTKLQTQNEELQAQSEELIAQTEEIQAQAEELAAQRDALEQKSIEAEEANRMKSIFLSNMSHELRTPLNSILGLVRLLQGDPINPLSPKQQEYLDIVLRNGQNLLDLINDILDLTRIESGREELHHEIINLPEFIENLAKEIAPLAEAKELIFEVNTKNMPSTMFSDAKKLRQILVNLIGNAVKFTDKGGIALTIEKLEGDDRDFVSFSVSDTGIGISKDALNIIFEPFRQVDGSYTRKYGGTGLGLSISKRLVALLGGDIQVDSELGAGSTFKVILPIDRRSKYRLDDNDWADRLKKSLLMKDENKSRILEDDFDGPDKDMKSEIGFKCDNRDRATEEEGHSDAVSGYKGKITVLLIDDDLIVGKEVGTMLRLSGYEVLYSVDSQVGIKMLRENMPDIVLLDLKMPIMDGFAFLREMRRDDSIKNTSVIILTALDIDSDTKSQFPPNVKAVLQKGNITQKELQKVISKSVAPKRHMEKIKDRIRGGDERPIKFSKAKETVLVAEDNMDNLFLIKEILEPRGYNIIHAKDGKEAVSLAMEHKPDIILMDIQMPELDGISAASRIRDKIKGFIPIVALTAKAMKGDKEHILNAGLDDYISKPFAPQNLLAIIEKWLDKRSSL